MMMMDKEEFDAFLKDHPCGDDEMYYQHEDSSITKHIICTNRLIWETPTEPLTKNHKSGGATSDSTNSPKQVD